MLFSVRCCPGGGGRGGWWMSRGGGKVLSMTEQEVTS